ALAAFDVSERLFHDGGEARDRLRVHQNRGLVLLQQGRLGEAESDFEFAESIAESLGMTAAQALSVANLAVLFGRARRLTDSLRAFERARDLFERAGNPARTVGHAEIDRAEVMMHSGLLLDAVEAGRAAVELVEPSGNLMLIGDAQLMVARTLLAAGKVRSALTAAERAANTFAESGRNDMLAHAAAVSVVARLRGARAGDDGDRALDDAAALASELRARGWQSRADEVVIERVQAAARVGRIDDVRVDLDRLRLGTLDGQRQTALPGWYAEALVRAVDGDVDGALGACRSGLGLLDDIVAEASSLEQRSASMRLGHDLSQLMIELAVSQRDADTVLAAAEGTRARALHDELLARERHRPLTEAGAIGLRSELSARLGDRTLVEWVVAGEEIWAVVFDTEGSRLIQIGDRGEVVRARDSVLVWLDVAASEPDASSARAERAMERLDRLLIEPLGLPDGRGVVLVPVDLLHGIPWSGLPSFAGRPASLAPNAQVWLEADRRAVVGARSVALVIGPGVDGAETERRGIEASHGSAAVAAGAGATTPTVRSMFFNSDVVHVAAHGSFRSDHPLLSTLRLHDGEASLVDVVPERVRSQLVVLSSCEGGAQGTTDGSEVLGLSAVLLARGAASVVAPLTVVRDLECADFVAEVHRELAAGEPIACAVANVRERWLADDDLSRWAVASSFTCFGSGRVTVAS
ncbi:CHAT domain-containing protein, partial [Ilumatobacter sp.]|uniref:CHAT domain-containing protein n=1 Tax=Ilumatobacter sp. TaxID=1967498 RepID=UPI003AF76A4C